MLEIISSLICCNSGCVWVYWYAMMSIADTYTFKLDNIRIDLYLKVNKNVLLLNIMQDQSCTLCSIYYGCCILYFFESCIEMEFNINAL